VGDFIACKNHTVIRNGPISSGVPGKYDTPGGFYTIQWKALKYDSKKYPSSGNTRNMDRALFFSTEGLALHAGSVRQLSHGCVHLRYNDADYLYHSYEPGASVVITKD
jgi:lipoprotein-anchoring transpeptidase ErfK/SrfK